MSRIKMVQPCTSPRSRISSDPSVALICFIFFRLASSATCIPERKLALEKFQALSLNSLCSSAGTLRLVYSWDIGLHRALNFFFWAYNSPPLLLTSLVLFIVDFFFIAGSVKRYNENPFDNTKSRCQACLMMLPPVGCFGIHHAYFRHWLHFFLHSATCGGCGIAYVADCFRLGKFTETANHDLHGSPQIEILARNTIRRYAMPTFLCLYRKYWLKQLPSSPFDPETQPLMHNGEQDELGATEAPPMQPTATHGATAGQEPLNAEFSDSAADQEELLSAESVALSVCPFAHCSGLGACCVGAPRQGIVHALTCSGLGVLFLIDLFSMPCRRSELNAHKRMRRRALNVGVPAPREEVPTVNAYGLCCSTGLCGGHQLVLGNFWLFLGTLGSLGGFGILYICDLFFLKGYLKTYNKQRANEEAFVETVERAKRWGRASMEVHDDTSAAHTVRTVTVASSSAEAAADAFSELDGTPAISTYTAWVCWLPFGGLVGLHHLYLGRYAHFLIAAFTINLFGVGWIADAFLMEWYIQDAAHKFNKAVQNAPARVHTTQPGAEAGLPTGAGAFNNTPAPAGNGQMYNTDTLVETDFAPEASTVMPPPVPGLYAPAAATASTPAYAYANGSQGELSADSSTGKQAASAPSQPSESGL